ncbi:MAG: hypothetical protein NW207_01590 [Cytophagales bacterium]|nr:hypothetical protein [Cytophagales bacterium]
MIGLVKENHLNKALIMLLCVVVYVYRNIEFFVNPVLNQEEGSIFYARAIAYGYKSMCMPHGGYYQFFQSFITMLTYLLVPMEYAPWVTSVSSGVVLLIPPALILWGRLMIPLDMILKSILCIMCVTACIPNFTYSVTNSHFVWALAATIVILCDDTTSLPKRIIFHVIFLIAGLSVVIPAMLLPVLAYIYYEKKQKYTLWYTLNIVCTLIVQIVFFIYTHFIKVDDFTHQVRFTNFDFSYFVYKYTVEALCGNFTVHLGDADRYVGLICMLFFILQAKNIFSNFHTKVLWMCIFCTSIFSHILSQNMAGGLRYFYVSNLVFFVYLLYNFHMKSRTVFSYLLITLFVFSTICNYSKSHILLVEKIKIDWKQEVKKYKENHGMYNMNIYPIHINADGALTPWVVPFETKYLQ